MATHSVKPNQSQLRSTISPEGDGDGSSSNNNNNITILDDIFEEILLTLDPPTLSQCAFVCKGWNSLITSPDFMSRYSHRNFRSSKDKIFLSKSFHGYSLHWDNDDLDLLRTVESPDDIDHFQEKKVVGTSNGLVCLVDDRPSELTLWNPTIRKYAHVLLPTLGLEGSSLGFGFDRKSEDFKVVNLVIGCHHMLDTAWVFSYVSWSWKHLTDNVPQYYIFDDISKVFLNGALHWIAWNIEAKYPCVLTFDLADEVFGEILIPESVAESSGQVSILTTGELLVLSHLRSPDCLSPLYLNKWSVWVMEQYGVHESWKKIVTISEEDFPGRLKIPMHVLAVRKNGEIIIEVESGRILIYNPTASTTNVPVYPTLRKRVDFIGYHDETLHLLEKVSKSY